MSTKLTHMAATPKRPPQSIREKVQAAKTASEVDRLVEFAKTTERVEFMSRSTLRRIIRAAHYRKQFLAGT